MHHAKNKTLVKLLSLICITFLTSSLAFDTKVFGKDSQKNDSTEMNFVEEDKISAVIDFIEKDSQFLELSAKLQAFYDVANENVYDEKLDKLQAENYELYLNNRHVFVDYVQKLVECEEKINDLSRDESIDVVFYIKCAEEKGNFDDEKLKTYRNNIQKIIDSFTDFFEVCQKINEIFEYLN